jgi:hypothetical protein
MSASAEHAVSFEVCDVANVKAIRNMVARVHDN